MKLTIKQLHHLIKEEVEKAIEEDRAGAIFKDDKSTSLDLNKARNALMDLGGEVNPERIKRLSDILANLLNGSGDTRAKSYVPNVRLLQRVQPGSDDYFDTLKTIGAGLKDVINQKKAVGSYV